MRFNLLDELYWLDAPGNDTGGQPQGGGQPQQPAPQLPPEVAQSLQNLMQRQGGPDATAVLLYQENRDYRERIRALEGQVPGEGAVVLSAEQAQQWRAYQQLGDPAALAESRQQLTTLQRNALMRDAAAAHGYKAEVLRDLPGIGDLTIEVREVEKDGKKAKVAVVVDGDQQRPLPDLIAEKWAHFAPALTADSGSQNGTPFTRQHTGGGSASSGDVVTAYVEKLNQRTQPKAATESSQNQPLF